MLSIFTIPKSFENNHIALIQTNAIKSWMQLKPTPEIVLFGDDPGVAEFASANKLKHIPDIKVNETATPYVSEAIKYMEIKAEYQTLCFVNCDIIIFQECIDQLKNVKLEKFLFVGQRWNLNLSEYLHYEDIKWKQKLLYKLNTEGELHPVVGIDYFIFPKGCMNNIPQMIVGRDGWDNWMIYYFRKNKIPVIDASISVKVIHQNHDYSHLKVKRLPDNRDPEGIHSINNIDFNIIKVFSLLACDYQLVNNQLRRNFARNNFLAYVNIIFRLNRLNKYVYQIFKRILKIFYK